MRPALQEDAASDEANRIGGAADEPDQPIALDLHPALAALGHYDGIYLVVGDMPNGARLSAGRSNGDLTWSLLPAEMENLFLTLPASCREAILTVSIVTPDPDGYEFASTSAQFNIIVADGTGTVPCNSLRQIGSHDHRDRPRDTQRAGKAKRSRLESILGDEVHDDTRMPQPIAEASWTAPPPREHDVAAVSRLLAAARVEWHAEEETRLARARERWEAEAEDLWVRRAAEMAERHARELQDAEARGHARALERMAVTEAVWSARLAAQEVAWRSEESQRFATALAHWRRKVRAERLRRAAVWFVFSVTIGSLMLA